MDKVMLQMCSQTSSDVKELKFILKNLKQRAGGCH